MAAPPSPAPIVVRSRRPKVVAFCDRQAIFMPPNHSFSSPQVTLVVGPKKVPMTAHKATLCQWSYFRVALLGNFKEATDQCIEMPEDHPETVQALLEFMYSGDYVFRSPFDQALKCTKRLNGSSMCPCKNFVVHGTPATEPTAAGLKECLVCEHTENDHRTWVNSSSMTPEQEFAKMEFHARVYFLADKIGASKLQKLATDRVYGSEEMLNVGTGGANYLAMGKFIYLNTPPGDKCLRKRALERTVHALLTANSVTPAMPGYGHQGLGSQGFGSQGFGSQGFGSQGFGSQGFGSQGFGSQGFGSQGFGSQGFGSQSFGCRNCGSQGPSFLRFASPGSGSQGSSSQGSSPRSDMTNELLEELVAQDPLFAFDIIKCMARNGVPKQKYL